MPRAQGLKGDPLVCPLGTIKLAFPNRFPAGWLEYLWKVSEFEAVTHLIPGYEAKDAQRSLGDT